MWNSWIHGILLPYKLIFHNNYCHIIWTFKKCFKSIFKIIVVFCTMLGILLIMKAHFLGTTNMFKTFIASILNLTNNFFLFLKQYLLLHVYFSKVQNSCSIQLITLQVPWKNTITFLQNWKTLATIVEVECEKELYYWVQLLKFEFVLFKDPNFWILQSLFILFYHACTWTLTPHFPNYNV